MKEPYELRVIADALERWTEGPAVNAMKYAMQTLREIADEIDGARAAYATGQVQVEQESIPSSPVPAVEVPVEIPTLPTPEPVAESPATSVSTPAASSHDPASGASGSSENPTPASSSEPTPQASSTPPEEQPSTGSSAAPESPAS